MESQRDNNEMWANKLIGKTLSDNDHSDSNFCKKDLPEKHRVITPGSVMTMDFVPTRLNVHVNEAGTVTKVRHG